MNQATESRQVVFERVLDAEGPSLRRLASAYEADPAGREDLVQEICLAIWTALPRFRGDSSLRTFVFRIAHNQAIKHIARAASCRGEDLTAAAELIDRAPDPEANAARTERAGRLHQAIRALAPVHREVLSLLLEGLSAREIGQVLGTTENSVAIRLTRARGALRALLVTGVTT